MPRVPQTVANARPYNVPALLACVIFLLSLVMHCQGEDTVGKPTINMDDYIQIPTDFFDHFPLLHYVEEKEASTAFAHITKDAGTWNTHSDLRSVDIPSVRAQLSFSYHNPHTGTITSISNTYQTVADTVYLEYLHSVSHVECGDLDSTITITYNASMSSSTQGLRFGLKRSHFTQFTKVSGGQSFFCKSSCAMGTVILRSVSAVVSHTEDSETGFLTSITIQTIAARPESLFNAVADLFMNGTFAVVPKKNLKLNGKSSRLNWHGYVKSVHVARETIRRRSAGAKLRAETCVGDFCYEIGVAAPGYAMEFRYAKSNAFIAKISHKHDILSHTPFPIQPLICSISITMPPNRKPHQVSCLCSAAARLTRPPLTLSVRVRLSDARIAMRMLASRSSLGDNIHPMSPLPVS
jgi:hypothetical protein